MGAGAAYTIDLAAGTYKLYVQTNTAGLPRPVARRRRASPPPRPSRSAPTPARTSLLAEPADVHPVRQRDDAAAARSAGRSCTSSTRDLGLRRGGHHGPRRGLRDRPRGGQLQAVRPDQHAGLRPTSGSAASSLATATTITVSANTSQDLVLASPPTFTLSGNVTTQRRTAQRDVRVRLRRDHLGLRRGGDHGPRRGLRDRPPGGHLQGRTSRPTRRPTPTSGSAARASPPPPSSRSAPTPARTSLLAG